MTVRRATGSHLIELCAVALQSCAHSIVSVSERYTRAEMMRYYPVVFGVQNQNRRLNLADPMRKKYSMRTCVHWILHLKYCTVTGTFRVCAELLGIDSTRYDSRELNRKQFMPRSAVEHGLRAAERSSNQRPKEPTASVHLISCRVVTVRTGTVYGPIQSLFKPIQSSILNYNHFT